MLDMIISLFRDGLSGTRYIIYVIICSTLLFSIVGYLFKQKYGKVEFKISGTTASSQASNPKKEKVKGKKNKKSKEASKTAPSPSVQPQPVTPPQAGQVLGAQPIQQTVPLQAQQPSTPAPIPDATTAIKEPTLVPKPQAPAQVQQQPIPATLNQATTLPNLGQQTTPNPAIDDDITTII